jgi:predicted dehydrogenase
VPMRIEMKRLSPGDTNNWFFEAMGTEGAVRFSTKEPRTLWVWERANESAWRRVDMGFETPFATITGKIFEPGFPDCLQQMLAAFIAERAGALGERLGCVTVEEAVFAHDLYAAALVSHKEKRLVQP